MRRVVIIVLIVFVLVNTYFLVNTIRMEGFTALTPLCDGELSRVLDTETIPQGEVSKFCVTESLIVLLYDEQGLANVYSHDGVFLYGLQVRTLHNGAGCIGFEKDKLFIRARGNRMFVFCGKKMIRSFLYSEDPTEFRRIERTIALQENHTIKDQTYHYLPDMNKIVKHTADGEMVDVISLPRTSPHVPALGVTLLLLIAALAHYLRFGNNPICRKRFKTNDAQS